MKLYRHFFKRVIDLLASFIGLIILSPIFIIVGIALFIANEGKPFFLQERPGKNEKTFKVIKFRSMNDKKDQYGNLLPDIRRLTRIGTFVRKTSLDEIPQLINVFKGDMSLVGPRPLLVKYLPYYSERESLRHSVRPGITGLSQVNGRNNLKWDDRLEMDVKYVESLSFSLDLKILLLTFMNVIRSKDNIVVSSELVPDLDDYRKEYD